MGYLLPALTEREVRQPARRRAERAPAELREPPVRPRRHGARRGAVSAGSSVSLADDRRRRRPPRGAARRRARVLPDLLPSGNASLALAGDIDTDEALALASSYFGELDAGRAAAAGRRSRRRRARGRDAAAARGPRRAAAPLPRLALAGAVRARTTRSWIWWPTCWRAARRRGSIARSSTSSGSPPRSRRRRTRARSAASSSSSPPRRPGARSPSSSGDRARDRRRSSSDGPTAAEMERVPGAGRGALHLPAADRRRLRRQVRSAERLQRVPRRSRVLRPGSRALPAGDAGGAAARRARVAAAGRPRAS